MKSSNVKKTTDGNVNVEEPDVTIIAATPENMNQVDSPDSLAATTRVYPFWHNLVAGGFAGAGSRVATAPLDLIRIRRQLAPPVVYPSESLWETWVKIVRNEGGITALFRGNLAAIFLWVGYSAVQFSLFSHIRDYIQSCNGSASVAAFWAGAAAGSCATIATYPFDLCRTTFAARGISNNETAQMTGSTLRPTTTGNPKAQFASSYRSPGQPVPFSSLMEPQYHRTSFNASMRTNAPPKTITEFAIQMYQQKGIRGFYYGAGPAVLQIIPYMGLNFMIYDALVAGDKRVQNSGYAGALSGATSKILVYPIDTVKRRLQAQAFYGTPTEQIVSVGRSLKTSKKYTSMVDCTFRIAKEEGFASFYRGLLPSVLKTTIASSLSFALFRFGKNTLEFIHDAAL
ncbi:hypothetical protein ACA910_008650 [Epithemia clementina (nom. ined.)]